MFVDFQLSHVGPLVNDFLYAMYMLFGPEERGRRRDELITYYLKFFADTLQKIGSSTKAPTFEEFQSQLFDNKYNGKIHLKNYEIVLLEFLYFSEFMLLTTFLPIQIAFRKNSLDPFRRRTNMYSDSDYQEEVEYLLDRMLRCGYFKEL